MTRRWGSAYQWVQFYLDQRYGHLCFFCGEKDKPLIVEHEDNDETNYNPENLHWACWSCNQRKNPRGPRSALLEGVSENTARAMENGGTTSDSLARASEMVPKYRNMLFHPHTGMMREQGARFPLVALAKKLPDLIGKGSSVTYRRYIEEDISAGYFDVTEEFGVTMIERTAKSYPLSKLGMKV